MLFPHGFARRLTDVSLDRLAHDGIRAILIDLDNTLLRYEESELAPEVVAWVRAARARGFAIALVSNNFAERCAAVAAQLDGIPVVASAMKPLPLGFARAREALGRPPKCATVAIGDQLLTDVLGARLHGVRTILTEPLGERGFITTRVMRVVERLLLRGRRP